MSSRNLSRPVSSRRNQRPMSLGAIRRAAMSLTEPRPGPENADMVEPVVESKKRIRKIGRDAEAKLPEKYELLDSFFNSFDSSVRLLQLKRKPTTFTNISHQVECLTKRRFLLGHLAQLKFLIPEAIVIKKILRRDELTQCMRPDLSVTLDFQAIDGMRSSKSKSRKHSELREVFHDRLLNFIKSHPEGDDVPEELIPDVTNRSKEEISAGSSSNESATAIQSPQTVSASHFKRSFALLRPKSFVDVTKFTSAKESACGLPLNSSCPVSTSHPFPETPVKSLISVEDQSSAAARLLKTPVELASTPAKLVSSRAILSTPKRAAEKVTGDDDNSLTSSSSSPRRRPSANRPLKFDTPVSKKRASSSSTGDIYEILDEDLLQSIQEKERIALIEQDPSFSQAKNRQKMISKLPKMFDMIRFFLQSIGRTVVPKEKLLEAMITGNSVIRDRTEVVEQLKLLQEIVPEWIYEKSASTGGEVLVCVNKDSSAEFIRKRLAEAK